MMGGAFTPLDGLIGNASMKTCPHESKAVITALRAEAATHT